MNIVDMDKIGSYQKQSKISLRTHVLGILLNPDVQLVLLCLLAGMIFGIAIIVKL